MIRTWYHPFLIAAAVVAGWPSTAASQTPADAIFDDTVVHDIRLTINSRDWESLKIHYMENTYYPCEFRWRDTTLRGIGIRSRGTGSRSGSKPGLRIDFDRYATNQRFLGLKSFILRNQTQDPSNMREVLSMALFRRMDVKAPREAFARLYVDNRYVGLYTIVESIDKPFVEQNFDKEDPYIFEYDFDEHAGQPYVFEYLGSDPDKYVPVPFKPETHESDPRPEVIERFIWTVNEAPDASWRQRMDEFLDLGKFMRHLGIENFLGEEDGLSGDYGPNNFYMFRPASSNRFTLVPWDKSNAFWESPGYYIFRNIRDGPPDHRNKLILRAFQHPDLLNTYLDTLLEAAEVASKMEEGETRGWLEREAFRLYELIGDAARSDAVKPFSNDDFEASIEGVKTFARERSESVRRQVADERRR